MSACEMSPGPQLMPALTDLPHSPSAPSLPAQPVLSQLKICPPTSPCASEGKAQGTFFIPQRGDERKEKEKNRAVRYSGESIC